MPTLPTAKLTCQQCQERKRKCSKTVPCSACVQAGTSCTAVQRRRLPRGRSGNQRLGNVALKDRIDKLEGIVIQLQRDASIPQHQDAIPSFATSEHDLGPKDKAKSKSFLASDFWFELTDAVSGLRDVLEDADMDDDATFVPGINTPSTTPLSFSHAASSTSNAHALLFQHPNENTGQLGSHPSPERREFLFQIYRERVDVIFKVLHWPSSYASFHANVISTEAQALETAVLFTAVCSLLNHEINDRPALVLEYRHRAESALAAVSVLTTTSLETLQALVIYLAGLRACQANAQQWTLTATAIRIASAQGIPAALSQNGSQEAELRRRVWCCIGILDMQSAFDRGSRPLLKSEDFQRLPLDVDDAEFNANGSIAAGKGSHGLTETSFTLLACRATACQLKLTELGWASLSSINPQEAGRLRLHVLQDFESYAAKLENLCLPQPTNLAAFTSAVAKESLTSMRLLLYRPLHSGGKSMPQPEKIDVLTTATEVLELSLTKRGSSGFAQYAWFTWPKWYALAVVLSELCVAHGPTAERGWAVAQSAYEDYARDVADTKSGLLWKPIAKLMKKVKEVRDVSDDTLPSASQLPGIRSDGGFADVSINMSMHQDELEVDDSDAMSWFHWDQLTEDILHSQDWSEDGAFLQIF